MKANLAAPRLWRLAFCLLAGLVATATVPTLAATGVDPECPPLRADSDSLGLVPPSLRIEVEPANPAVAVPIASPSPVVRTQDDDAQAEVATTRAATTSQLLDELLRKRQAAARTENPPGEELEPGRPSTATRLPGIDDEDLPRFRRHMFRTDI